MIVIFFSISIFGGLIFYFCNTNKEKALSEQYESAEYFYGKKLFSEIDYKSTNEEEMIGEKIMKQMEDVLSYIGREEDAAEMGALDTFYWFNQGDEDIRPATQKSKVIFFNAKISRDEGHVWCSYTVRRYDEEGEIINYSGDIPTLLYIKK